MQELEFYHFCKLNTIESMQCQQYILCFTVSRLLSCAPLYSIVMQCWYTVFLQTRTQSLLLSTLWFMGMIWWVRGKEGRKLSLFSLLPERPCAHWSPHHIPMRKGINKRWLGASLVFLLADCSDQFATDFFDVSFARKWNICWKLNNGIGLQCLFHHKLSIFELIFLLDRKRSLSVSCDCKRVLLSVIVMSENFVSANQLLFN